MSQYIIIFIKYLCRNYKHGQFSRDFHFLVHISEGSELNITNARVYRAEDTPYIVVDPPTTTSSQLSVAVQLATNTGYMSQMSEVFSFIPPNGNYNVDDKNLHDINRLSILTFLQWKINLV